MKRSGGILMHISSLPSPCGIGTFGKAAYAFVDFLKAAGQSRWQLLPIGPTGYGDSPYQSFSTFAGNPYFIDLALLEQDGLLQASDYADLDWGDDPLRVDYGKLHLNRFSVLRVAYANLTAKGKSEVAAFARENADWLEDYALFMAVKARFDGAPWHQWEDGIHFREQGAMARYESLLTEEIGFWRFVQHTFFRQWRALKRYANQNGIRIIGDLPIYVAADSADVWAHPSLFLLDEQLCPTMVAGCPPDAFSRTGQLWGNPLYRWDVLQESGYAWWIARLRAATEQFDILRLDHFRGFDHYYAIPAKDKTAEHGVWLEGPGYAFFRALGQALGRRAIIAEDLGFLTDSVRALQKRTGYPGMKVLQFAFDAGGESEYLPHRYDKNCVVYTGTHDNDTALSWLAHARRADARFCRKYLNLRRGEPFAWALIRCAWASVGDTAIAPMQDFLSLGGEARMNTPSTLGGNWAWRMATDALSPALAARIRELTALYGRCSR